MTVTMTRDEHRAGVIALKAKAVAAQTDGRYGEAMLIASNVAELMLEHPEFWPSNIDRDKFKADLERLIEATEKQLGMR